MRWLSTMAGVMFACAAPHAAAQADDYPRRPVKLVIPNAPGSSNDVLTRILAQYLGEELGQPLVVENIAGASGILGMEIGKHASPDGYTLIAASPSGTTLAASLRKLSYDPINDFQYIALYAVLPNLLVVNPSVPVKTLPEMIEYFRAAKGDIFMASAGPGTQSHIGGVMLQQMGGFPSVHVPYKGGGPSVLALMSGEAQWSITPASAVVGHVRAGKLRAIAQSMPQRTPTLPGVPTVAETLPGYSFSAWNGLIAPKGTPPAIVNKVRVALARALARAELKDGFARQGADAVMNTPEEFRRMVAAEIETTSALVKAANLKID